MNFPFYIARRYIFSKKSTNAINVISAISVVGVAVATMALVIVLSVFNGFHDLVASFFTNFDPQIEIVPTSGKTAPADDPVLTKIRQLPDVAVATDVVEDQALAIYGRQQQMVTVMGVQNNFQELTNINDILYGDGEFTLQAANLFYAIPGIRLAQDLGMSARFDGYLKLYAPVRRGQLTEFADPSEGFVVDSLISPGVVYAVNQAKYDRNRLICSVDFARRLFDQDGMLSSLQIRLKPGTNLNDTKKEMQDIVGNRFRVLDRFEQQADTFNIMQIEKVLAYVFLTFILMVACFNIISSLFEGRIISAAGAVVGILLGLLLCWLQQEFGFVHMGDSAGSFVVNAYPVSVHYDDVAIVFVTVLLIGWAAAWIPTRNLKVQR